MGVSQHQVQARATTTTSTPLSLLETSRRHQQQYAKLHFTRAG
jgi:hypothetical protein